MNNNLFRLMVAQFKVFLREPGVLFWVFGFPILMAWVLGVAFSSDQETIKRIAVIQENATAHDFSDWVQQNSQLIESEKGQRVFEATLGSQPGEKAIFRFFFVSGEEAHKLLKKGKVTVILEEKGQSGQPLVHFDPKHTDSKTTYLLLKNAVNLGKNTSSWEPMVNPLSTIGNRYIDFLIPGLIAIGIMNSCIWGIGWTLIEMRMKKLLRRIVATPLKKTVFLSSHFANRLIVTHFELGVLYLFSWLYFDIRIEGSLWALFLMLVAGNIAFAGIGVAISCRAQQTIVANGLINAITLPMIVLSGIFFSYYNFPDAVVMIVRYLPLTLLTDGIRSVFIEGAQTMDIIENLILLVCTGFITFFGGLKFYKWH